MAVIKVDQKGPLHIPRRDREALGVQPGDVFFVERDGDVLKFAKVPNPFDILADAAIEERHAGRRRDVRELMAELGTEHENG